MARIHRGTYRCSFCGKSQDQVERLIAGPGGVYICDECVGLCQEIITEERAPRGAIVCSFCGRAQGPAEHYILGSSGASICRHCLDRHSARLGTQEGD